MFKRFLKYFSVVCLLTSAATLALLFQLYQQLPEVQSLRDIQLQVPLRIFTADHKLMAEFGEKRRIPVSIEEVPKQLIQAFIAIEDRRFYQHRGVDIRGLLRAAVHLVSSGNKGQGGSTITMQVARNFFLSRAKTYSRKLNEILLAIKIEQELTKDEILELYLNKVFLGYRAYGVAAAAEVYYGEALENLSLAQYAMLAGLPKAPSAINPLANPEAAEKRRAHVLESMLEMGFISKAAWITADTEPLVAKYHGTTLEVRAPYVAEMVRQELIERFGPDAYTQGLQVFTTIHADLQEAANQTLRAGLLNYDQRHGLRPTTHYAENLWQSKLQQQPSYGELIPAIVSQVAEKSVQVQTKEQQFITIDWPYLSWAKRSLGPLKVTPPPETALDIVKVGDLVYIQPQRNHVWKLVQLPEVEGALVSINPKNGAILALVGGFDYNKSKFNRATQAELQPGSSFKPFVYAAALANGFTAATIINDAPIVFNDPAEEALWRPQNDNKKFAGPTSFRNGLIRSRNLVSIRVLQAVGIENTIAYLARFGFAKENIPKGPSLALGTANVSPLQMIRGYGILANGGQNINIHFIDRVEDSLGQSLYESAASNEQAQQVIDARDAYMMTNLLQDVIKRGTGRGALSLKREDIAGKTGTTNDQYDAWFSGYTGDIATTVWVGFDNPQSLGEYAARVALPIWRDYMKIALQDRPEYHYKQPTGLVTVKIDPATGLLAHNGQANAIFEIFREESAPQQYTPRHNSGDDKGRNPSGMAPEHIF